MDHFQSIFAVKFSKTGQLDITSGINFGCLEASAIELHQSENSAVSSKRAGSVRLTPQSHLLCSITLRSMKQRRKPDLTLAYLKSTRQDVSNEV